MKTKITTRTVTLTYLDYTLSREEQEILAKSNKILRQLFGTIEECTGKDMNDFDELIEYFNYVFDEDVEAYDFTLCGIIDTIYYNSNRRFIASQENYTND